MRENPHSILNFVSTRKADATIPTIFNLLLACGTFLNPLLQALLDHQNEADSFFSSGLALLSLLVTDGVGLKLKQLCELYSLQGNNVADFHEANAPTGDYSAPRCILRAIRIPWNLRWGIGCSGRELDGNQELATGLRSPLQRQHFAAQEPTVQRVKEQSPSKLLKTTQTESPPEDMDTSWKGDYQNGDNDRQL